MRPFTSRPSAQPSRRQIAAALALGGLLFIPGRGTAQTTAPADAAHAHPPTAGQAPAAAPQDQELQKQIAELRVRVAKLQAALDQQQKSGAQTASAGAPASPPQAPGRRMMGEMGAMPPGGEMGAMPPGGMGASQPGRMAGGGMGMMDMDKGEMGMPPDGMKMPGGMMMDEMGMGSMPSGPDTASGGGMTAGGTSSGSGTMSGMKTSGGGKSAASPAARSARVPRSMSSLPGVPGASHVYHVGSTGFFLDQPRLSLTTQQQSALNRIKERALLERESAERRIQQAEQELWALTGADQPDAAKVQAKLQEIEQIRTNQRSGFISAVGEGARLLTAEQQATLLGTAAPTK